MQAALSLSQLGLKVSLYEKDRRLGGLMNLAAMPPFKFRIGQLRDYLIRQIYKSNIEIILNHAYTLSDLQQDHPDYLVVATGSRPVVPPINGWNPEFCTIVESVLTSPSMWENKQVVVIGGGRSGCEVARLSSGR
jgi:NADPH-dependent 2,4-dienoyl-CoA reductase/sulfur reductase-like enzyme